jgi:hypothetical protein
LMNSLRVERSEVVAALERVAATVGVEHLAWSSQPSTARVEVEEGRSRAGEEREEGEGARCGQLQAPSLFCRYLSTTASTRRTRNRVCITARRVQSARKEDEEERARGPLTLPPAAFHAPQRTPVDPSDPRRRPASSVTGCRCKIEEETAEGRERNDI